MRGSLVRRESVGLGDNLRFQIVLTDTATQFLSRRVQPDETMQRQLQGRDHEFREVQERRLTDMAARSLAPVVVRQRTEVDAPTCTLLRQALLFAKRGADRETVYEKIDLARRMNPDFWEVDRVEGFIRDSYGDLAVATSCYERAYSNASRRRPRSRCIFLRWPLGSQGSRLSAGYWVCPRSSRHVGDARNRCSARHISHLDSRVFFWDRFARERCSRLYRQGPHHCYQHPRRRAGVGLRNPQVMRTAISFINSRRRGRVLKSLSRRLIRA